ncbi:MAG TPA: indole-3-glycerol phosphate synthase TrpC [Pyrinomonadaceae bacterium]|nr:indole-3-glycerol phosphate synthase TrpC [Pyrinomonadaceae bacterium]
MSTVTNFLDEIIHRKRVAVARAKAESKDIVLSAHDARRNARAFALSHAIKSCKHQFPIIAEFKRASPSKGELRANANASDIARTYEKNGVCAISVLTDEEFFHGSLDDLAAVKTSVSLPVLRKDFVIDEFQVLEAAIAGADAVLLIVAALMNGQLRSLRKLIEDELKMDALVEVHSVDEMKRAGECGARLIGVNNRDLRTFQVALSISEQCVAVAPPDAILISESGLRDGQDLQRLRSGGYDGFLIGEALMTANDPGEALRSLLR